MSSVTLVPEMALAEKDEVDAGDATEVLARLSKKEILTESFERFRYADGFSYARSLAFQSVMAIIPGIIFVVALAVRLGEGKLQSILRAMIESLAPGPAGEIFLEAFNQGSQNGSSGSIIALVGGGTAMLVGATAGMAQLQRGASRIYGVDVDRPTLHRYGLALVLTLSVGVLFTAAFLLTALGGSVAGYFQDEVAAVWRWVRWPGGLAVLTLAFAILYRIVPNRTQPSPSWLAVGSAIGVTGWFAVSGALALYFNASRTFGETYGPLAGFIGIMLWAQLSAIAIFYGLAFAAQLEAERAGVTEPRDEDATE